MPTIPTILVSDAGDDIRSKIENLIKSQSELSFLKTVGKADAEEEIQGATSTIVWIELESGAPEGLALLKQLITTNPGSYFIVSKEEIDADLVKKAMQVGALDFLDHKGWAAQIRSVIRRVTTKEWGAQKSQSAIRSAIPNQNIKKSGAWSMPGRQSHKPTAFEANKPKPLAVPQSAPKPQPVKISSQLQAIEEPPKAVEAPEAKSEIKNEPAPTPEEEPKAVEAFPLDEPTVEEPVPSAPVTPLPEEEPEPEPVTEPEPEPEPEPQPVPEPEPVEEDQSAQQMLESLMASAASETVQSKTDEVPEALEKEEDTQVQSATEPESPVQTEEIAEKTEEKSVQETLARNKDLSAKRPQKREVKKSKWEELDSLISAHQSSQQKVDAYKEKPFAKKEGGSEGGIDQETKEALLDAVDKLDSIQNLPVHSDSKQSSPVKESSWDELDSIVKPKEADKDDQKAVQAFPDESRWGNLDAVTDDVIEASKSVPEDKWGDLDKVLEKAADSEKSDGAETQEPEVAESDSSFAATAPDNSWGDLDSIPTPGQTAASQDDEEPAGLSSGGPKWGDLDSIPTPGRKEVSENIDDSSMASMSMSGTAAGKWGDLDSIPSPQGATSAGVSEDSSGANKWGDLDSIPTPGKTSEFSKPVVGSGSAGGMFSDIAGLDEAKLDSDPAAPSSLSSAKWGDEGGGDSPGGLIGSRTGKLGRTTGSFSQLQSDPSENLVSREADSQEKGKGEGEEEVKPKAMPIPQAQAPNKWTGTGGGTPTAVSSSLKAIDGKKSKPLLQKGDVKVSITPSWMFISYSVASISTILVLLLSFSFFLY